MIADANAILAFWFDEANKPFWFKQNDGFDALIRSLYEHTFQAAAAGELYGWREDIHGRLAEIIVLDQFSRNLFRDSAQAFAQDAMAVVLAQEAAKQDAFEYMLPEYRHFALMPLMHSESAAVHDLARRLFTKHTSAYVLEIELKHKAVIDRFGRYPHRNELLGRRSTAEELAFLKEHGRGF